MCLGIPGKVVRIEGKIAEVDIGGNKRKVSIMLLDDVQVGEYVLVHAGFAIVKYDEKEAKETLKLLNELFILGTN